MPTVQPTKATFASRPSTRTVARTAAPSGQWKAQLCDCCTDPSLCCSITFCSCNATGQAYARATRNGKTCMIIAVISWFVFVASQVIAYASRGQTSATSRTLNNVAAGVGGAGALLSLYFICTARRLVREQERIPNGPCGPCDDFCAAYFCGVCTLFQIFRQGDVTGSSYRACTTSGEADPLV
jgi:Cys-rich protein (TIGR01571 family)